MTQVIKMGAFAILALSWSNQSRAAEFETIDLGDGDVAIALDGEIIEGDAEKFRREAAKHSSAMVLLNSDGGSTIEAIEIGEAIRLKGFSTLVLNTLKCNSACGLIWLAGSPRALSKSAKIGFHATYTDDSGQKIESGMGNAIVGRYFTLLNLPLKAIVFATREGPDRLSWLHPENYLENGIDARIVDNWEEETPDAKAPEEPPPPIEVRVAPKGIQTSVWKSDDIWTVKVDHTLDNSCFTYASFEGGTIFRIGFDLGSQGKSYFMLANEAWRSLKEGNDYSITITFDDETPWTAPMSAVTLNDVLALQGAFSDSQFWAEFGLAKRVQIEREGREIVTLNLTGSRKALDDLLACQRHYSATRVGSDPFAE